MTAKSGIDVKKTIELYCCKWLYVKDGDEMIEFATIKHTY